MARASTRVFVREGARVLAADISGREKETAEDLGDAVVPVRCDVTEEDQVQAMFAAALDAFGRVDAVLNVAGIGSAGVLAEVTMEDDDRIMDVDLRGVLLGTKHGIRAIALCPGFIETEMSGGPGAAERHPSLVQGTAPQAGRPARGGGRAGRLPVLRACALHHRRRHPDRRWDDRHPGVTTNGNSMSGSGVYGSG
jgi:NAD(P)-dependent dehydrogenase (short-subunit alcohol dehydrogenase family)